MPFMEEGSSIFLPRPRSREQSQRDTYFTALHSRSPWQDSGPAKESETEVAYSELPDHPTL